MWRAQSVPRPYLVPPAIAATERSLYLYGGLTNAGTPLGELWELDLGVGRWSRVLPDGVRPPASASGHSLVAVRDRLLLIGATTSDEPTTTASSSLQPGGEGLPHPAAELWTLALPSLNAPSQLDEADSPPAAPAAQAQPRWERHSAPRPLGRFDHCAVAYEEAATMLVHGGTGPGGLLDDLWRWDDLVSRTAAKQADGAGSRLGGAPSGTEPWKLLSGDYEGDAGGTGGLRPSSRHRHSCAALPLTRQLVVAGGVGAGGDVLHDAWLFELGSRIWQPLAPVAGVNGPRPPPPLPQAVEAAQRASGLVALEPPLVGVADRAVRLACVPATPGAANRTESVAGAEGDPSTVWQYSGARGAWEQLRARPDGAARLAPPPCPRQLGFARGAGAGTGSRGVGGATPRLFLIGTGAPQATTLLWEYGAGTDCGRGCRHGACDPASGVCVCESGWGGDDCSVAVCAVPCGEHGRCDALTGRCECMLPWYGTACDRRSCAADCVSPRGTCDTTSGRCVCVEPWYGRACDAARCPACVAPNSRCDNTTGCCTCAPGYEGCDCSVLSPGRWHRVRQPVALAASAAAPSAAGGGSSPSWRYDSAAALCNGRPLVYGGVAPEGDGEALAPSPTGEHLSSAVWAAAGADAHSPRWERLLPFADALSGEPSARRGAAAAGVAAAPRGAGADLVGTGLSPGLAPGLAVHGGIDGFGSPSAELWVLRCAPIVAGAPPSSWRRHTPSLAEAAPCARAYHTLSSLRQDDGRDHSPLLLLYGGSADGRADGRAGGGGNSSLGSGRALGDLWAFSPPSVPPPLAGGLSVLGGTWRLLAEAPAETAEERYRGGATGRGPGRGAADTSPLAPPARYAHAAVVHRHGECCERRGCLLVFGGVGMRHRPLNDMWQFCVSSERWRRLARAADGTGWPAARQYHSLTQLTSAAPGVVEAAAGRRGAPLNGTEGRPATGWVLLFGGSVEVEGGSGARPSDELWLFSLATERWVRVHTPAGAPRPAARFGHSAASVREGGSLWLFGGLHGGPAGASTPDPRDGAGLADTWHFPLPANLSSSACAGGCSAHGACDLRQGRCVCDPPWAGPACDEAQRPPAAGEETRRALRALLWLCAALSVGGALGWWHRHREIAQAEREAMRLKR